MNEFITLVTNVKSAANDKSDKIKNHLVKLAKFFGCEVYDGFLKDVLECIKSNRNDINKVKMCIREKLKNRPENRNKTENEVSISPPSPIINETIENNERDSAIIRSNNIKP
jgi:hypothetical protein